MGVFGRRGGSSALAEPALAGPAAVTPASAPPAQIADDGRSEARALAIRLDASRAAMSRRQLRLERELADKLGRAIRLKPLLLIPEPCWRGRHGKFLLHALQLNPYDPWNVALLPQHPADAALVEAPLHPGEPGPREIGAVNEMLAELRRAYAEAYEQMDWTADRAQVAGALERAIERVKGYAADELTALSPSAEADPAD